MTLSKPSKKIVKWIMISAGIMIVLGTIVYRSFEVLPFAFSVAIVSALNVGKIYLLERTVIKISEMDEPNYGKIYVKFQYLIRYFGTALVLLAIGLTYVYSPVPIVNIWGAVAGIFTMQIAVVVTRFSKFDEEPSTDSNQDK